MLALKHEDGGATAQLGVRLLNPSTKIANDNKQEEVIKEVILELADMGLLGWYEFYTMRSPGSVKGWKVDFVTNLVYSDEKGDRLVVIEPHSSFKEEDSEKIRRIRNAYGLFVILISKNENAPMLFSEGDPNKSVKFFDIYWQMPNHLDDENRFREEKGRMKERIYSLINDERIRMISMSDAQRMLLDRINISKNYENSLKESVRRS